MDKGRAPNETSAARDLTVVATAAVALALAAREFRRVSFISLLVARCSAGLGARKTILQF